MCVAHCGRAKSNPNVLFRADDYMEDNLINEYYTAFEK